jgi:DNA-binding NarL/FixJ family response regulator
MIGIVVADDHEVVRTGFAAMLGTQPDFNVRRRCGPAASSGPTWS